MKIHKKKIDIDVLIRYSIPLICSVFILLSLVMTICMKKITFSENENRVLQSMPKVTVDNIVSAKFMKEFDSFMSDNYPYRKFWVSLKAQIELLTGKNENNNVYVGKEEYLIGKYDEIKKDDLNKISFNLNKFIQSNGDIDMTFMLAPNSVEINKDRLPDNATAASQAQAIDYFYNKLDDRYNKINLIEALNKANKEYNQVYFRLDHHWNSYGAYIAYVEYCKLKSIIPNNISDYLKDVVTTDFNGTYYSKASIYSLTPDKIEVLKLKKDNKYIVSYLDKNIKSDTLYVKEHLNKKDKYSYFLDSNHPVITIENSSNQSGAKLLVLKDSYANILLPFLADHYSTIYVIDPRYYSESISEYIQDNNIKNVLFVYNLATMEPDMGIRKIK